MDLRPCLKELMQGPIGGKLVLLWHSSGHAGQCGTLGRLYGPTCGWQKMYRSLQCCLECHHRSVITGVCLYSYAQLYTKVMGSQDGITPLYQLRTSKQVKLKRYTEMSLMFLCPAKYILKCFSHVLVIRGRLYKLFD